MTDVATTIDLTEAAARELTDSIKQSVSIVWRQVERAYLGRAWLALGYGSWDEYCDTEFDGARLRLPREERTMIVGSLHDAGLSTRAIAAAVGVDDKTVRNDLAAGAEYSAPDPDDEIVDAEIVAETEKPRVTGTDGKSYPARVTGSSTPRVDSIRDLAKLGLTAEQIAEAIGISSTRVHAIAKTNKIRLPGNAIDREEKINQAREMAAEGYTSAQIGSAIGVENMHYFRQRYGIEVPADAVVGNRRSIDSRRIVHEAVMAADGVGLLLDQVDYSALDPEDITGWVDSLNESIRSLTTLRNRLKEMTQP